VHDAHTGAAAVRREPSAVKPARAPPPLKPPEVTRPEFIVDVPTQMEPVKIEHRRDFGVARQSILPTDRAAPLYHHVVTRAEIEQSGVTNMAEFLTTVPGYSGEGAEPLQATADLTFSGNANIQVGSFLKLRGWDSQHTAVLLNGR
jgi:hypothetical protein